MPFTMYIWISHGNNYAKSGSIPLEHDIENADFVNAVIIPDNHQGVLICVTEMHTTWSNKTKHTII